MTGGRAHGRGGVVHEEDAQSTVEFAAVFVGVLSIIVALGALWRAGSDGVLTGAVERAASHALDAGGAVDISLY